MRLVGINHVALEVGDVEEALAWYGRFFKFELRGRAGTAMAFIDIGDQFIAMAAGRSQPPDQARHFGLVVDDKQAVRAALQAAGVSVQASGSVDFLDPRGNHVQVVDYREIQFSREDPRREAGAPQQGSRRRLTVAADRFHGRRRSVTNLAPVARHCWHERMRRRPPVARRLQFVFMKEAGLSMGVWGVSPEVIVVLPGEAGRFKRRVGQGLAGAGVVALDAAGRVWHSVKGGARVGGGEQRSSLYRLIAV